MAPREDQYSTQSSSSSAASTSCSSHGGSLELSSSSRSITKKPQKKPPIIRVVHVFAPKLIKTDPANFRALVQQLTGSTADPKHEEETRTNDHDDGQLSNHQCNPSSNSDHHENTNNLHYNVANYGNYEGIRVLDSSRPSKREIDPCRQTSVSAVFDTTSEIEALQVAQNLKDATMQNGLFLGRKLCGFGINGDREDDDTGLASIDDSANHDERARTAEDIIDEYWYNMSSPSSLGAMSSSCNTESAGLFEGIRDGLDEGLEAMGCFCDGRRHYLMQFDGELLLHTPF